MRILLYIAILFLSLLAACSGPGGLLPKEGGSWHLEAYVEEFRMGEGRVDRLAWQDYIDRYYAGGFLTRDEWPEFQSSFSFMGWELRHLASELTPPEDRSQWVWLSEDQGSGGTLIFGPDGDGTFMGRDSLMQSFSWDFEKQTDRITLTWQGLQKTPASLSFVILDSKKEKQIWQADHEARLPNPFTAAESETLFTVRWQLRRN